MTNDPRPNAELKISIFELIYLFHALVVGSECERTKPFPDSYLRDLKEFNASPKHTIIFEDSMSGVKAGVDDERMMHPRSSFQAFLDVVKTKRQLWSNHEMDAIHSLQLILRGTINGIKKKKSIN
ncbi:Phytochrome A [Dendrobium catenatum]|uniref:Phytochrome A n=1 Tax=Dendrobium catenatum TaxID=906689 RepID=A0A2I0XGU8_9ASPA|nr:Phytochrome A [Dendrobium catenatum]